MRSFPFGFALATTLVLALSGSVLAGEREDLAAQVKEKLGLVNVKEFRCGDALPIERCVPALRALLEIGETFPNLRAERILLGWSWSRADRALGWRGDLVLGLDASLQEISEVFHKESGQHPDELAPALRVASEHLGVPLAIDGFNISSSSLISLREALSSLRAIAQTPIDFDTRPLRIFRSLLSEKFDERLVFFNTPAISIPINLDPSEYHQLLSGFSIKLAEFSRHREGMLQATKLHPGNFHFDGAYFMGSQDPFAMASQIFDSLRDSGLDLSQFVKGLIYVSNVNETYEGDYPLYVIDWRSTPAELRARFGQ